MSHAALGVTILGATGSIGQNALNIISQHPDKFKVIALSAYQNVGTLFEQCKQFKPAVAVMVDEALAIQLADLLKAENLPTQVLSGSEGLETIAKHPQSIKVVCGIVGAAGLLSTLSAVKAGKQVLIANKEPLVMAGDLLIDLAEKSGATLLPVDSEHNALFQCMPANYKTGSKPEGVKQIILTASGGPFLNFSQQALESVTPEMACTHPNWRMGKKITVDCATLMNKGLEVIEASKLYRLNADEIDVVIHPQSIIHSLVEYIDGSLLAQLGVPDMRVPLTHCLAWPWRETSGANRLSLTEIGNLTFLKPDKVKFRCLELAYTALRLGNAAPCVLNASNEVAVEAFLNGHIRFLDIPFLNETVLQQYAHLGALTLDEILQADALARKYCSSLIEMCEQPCHG
ncbi:MAG: 1-deoxy-D-xylulose-5-phosphate reductoisomerase [Proteobacteria bacterium]|nr:1-deoxy-D-xylulose-5-phosphate reductoisomerase [Pseudomonadota bacterium]